MIERWIAQGAKTDTPANAISFKLSEPPTYASATVISALAYSPDGKVLAISGYHEVLLHTPDGSNLVARLVGESPRIESLCYSPDGKMLAVAGSAASRLGENQPLDTPTHGLIRVLKLSNDSLYRLSV